MNRKLHPAGILFAVLFLAFFFAFASVLMSRDALAQTVPGGTVDPSSGKNIQLALNIDGNAKKPNVVFIMADNLGYGDLGCYGGGETRGMSTKNIDKLASESLRFTQFLVEPQCTPTRAAVMTGQYPVRLGLSLVLIEGVPGASGLTSKDFTVAEMFKDIGYDTAIYGKWHLGIEGDAQPQKQGFDEWYGIPFSTDVSFYIEEQKKAGIIRKPSQAPYIPCIMEAKAGEEAKKVKPYNLKTRRTIDVELTEKSIDYIKSHAKSEKPFFLYLPFTRPHYPNLPSKKFEGASRIGNYGDSVMELDHNTGRVLKAIRDAGIEDNIIVVWISDNGPMDTTTWPDSGFAGPYRGELGDPHEGSVRTAGMIKWPGKIKPGVSNEMFAAIDFLPTLAAMTGGRVPTDRPIDGVDQSPFLFGKQKNRTGSIF